MPPGVLQGHGGLTDPTPTLQRHLGRRESYAETHLAIAGLVWDRAARR
jgi:hypothetical protein